jgi:hypothetical protein
MNSYSTKKYQVYRNDLKFKEHRNINPNNATWDDDI